jgi:hypothetical protein
MALTFAELESVTDDYFLLDNGAAVDIYFNTSFLLEYFLNQKKGIWDRPDGGMKIRVPLEYDGQEAGFYARGETISSDDRESVNAAYFQWAHAYGNATIYRIDSLQNSGEEAHVQLVQQRVGGAQKSLTKVLADSLFDDAGGSTKRLTGLRACCNATTSTTYGSIAEDDLVSADGTKPWTGRRTTTATVASLDWIRTMRSTAKIRDGARGKPDLVVTTETLFNALSSILQHQQMLTEGKLTANTGFTGINFEGCTIMADDYCPSGYGFGVNTNFAGFAVHKDGLFMRTEWRIIPDSPEDKTMKIYFDGNFVVNNRKGQICYSSVS